MLSQEDNELLTRVGPGTPIGELLRRYWQPALLAAELPEPDGAPCGCGCWARTWWPSATRAGRVGLLGAHCPHRGASLFFGRNEECGLRCVYHGWKFDVDGQLRGHAREPPESNFKDKIHHTAYPCAERGGVIWAYLGPSHPAAAAARARMDRAAARAALPGQADAVLQLGAGAGR